MSAPRPVRLALILLVVIVLLSIVLALGLRKTVTLSIDGQSRRITTYAFNGGSLLHQQDIPLSPHDELSPSADAWLKNGSLITLLRSIPVQILADGKITSIYSTKRIPSTLFTQAGISLFPDDIILSNGQQVVSSQPFPASSLSISLQVIRSITITLTEGSQTQSLTSPASSLGSALW